jgi:hypothetical protein
MIRIQAHVGRALDSGSDLDALVAAAAPAAAAAPRWFVEVLAVWVGVVTVWVWTTVFVCVGAVSVFVCVGAVTVLLCVTVLVFVLAWGGGVAVVPDAVAAVAVGVVLAAAVVVCWPWLEAGTGSVLAGLDAGTASVLAWLDAGTASVLASLAVVPTLATPEPQPARRRTRRVRAMMPRDLCSPALCGRDIARRERRPAAVARSARRVRRAWSLVEKGLLTAAETHRQPVGRHPPERVIARHSKLPAGTNR